MTSREFDPKRYAELKARAEAAADRFHAAGVRLARALELRYDRSQPRHPAGTPEGGRWSGGRSGGIGSDFVAAPDVDEQARQHWLQRLHEPPRSEVVINSGLLIDGAGNPVRNMYGEAVLFPLGFPQDQILAEAKSVRTYLESSNMIDRGLLKMGSDLWNFRQGGPWDAQRETGEFIWEHRDYSTILIGMYGQSAGISEEDILNIQNFYAKIFSNFPKYEPMNSVYTSLSEGNVRNTHTGYLLSRELQ